ncbi:hypothetical protein NM688_g9112 [Phlebia brevispora]|uniref:Uncharacterized protein n=1 Tax=Phlebia brevispora TaxID=194682 RepID=A0ACC1RKR0_9APHY|nr:hypothetical protein NM688_g9112 [Phlebia brevispora]
MNGLHDNAHKRTSITELLNPVASSSSPSGSLDASYSSPQLNNLSSGSYASAPQQQHVSPSTSHYPMSGTGSSFSLRAASWDHTSTESPISTQRRQEPEASSSSCRYGSSTPHSGAHASSHQPNSHSVYAEQYQRPRPVDETANFGMDVSWSPSPHEHPQPIPYGAQLVSPVTPMVYTEDRASISSGDGTQKSPAYTPPAVQAGIQPGVQPAQFDQQEMHPQAQYLPNGYIPLMIGHTNPRSMQPQGLMPHAGVQSVPGVHQVHQVYVSHAQMFAIPVMMQAAPPMKRQMESGDEEPAGPKKRPRAKAKPSEGNSRRGYNSKKRNEAAQIAAQSTLPTQASTKGKERESSKESDRAPPSMPVAGTTTLHPELQFARCMSNRYRTEEFPRCVSCTRRWAGDTCRFQGIRFFLKDENRNIIGISFVENHKADGPSMNFPVKWNVTLALPHIDRLKVRGVC